MYYNRCSREVNTLRKDFQIGSTIEKWGFSSAGRAPALHAGGQEFESPNLHHKKPNDICYSVFYFARVVFELNKPSTNYILKGLSVF